ncbi:uncharacterized protein TRAVEDRAFT_75402 [Trametes versicolor FP-101664 SS1]|uniref:uncharacterized protein n=1 Tax=Trametes versicolor (strain FP-101664) TaxID=717944 RepID=UPI0004622373|nr:uncharacterized protein TRAVEDRAFT_75402 [Trametes versicolor FP-101664 SS1]EIW52449.1 hypothetical protein TRAVEDRAFT_75402 [Trametes versicolor FP-101664 SS1]
MRVGSNPRRGPGDRLAHGWNPGPGAGPFGGSWRPPFCLGVLKHRSVLFPAQARAAGLTPARSPGTQRAMLLYGHQHGHVMFKQLTNMLFTVTAARCPTSAAPPPCWALGPNPESARILG